MVTMTMMTIGLLSRITSHRTRQKDHMVENEYTHKNDITQKVLFIITDFKNQRKSVSAHIKTMSCSRKCGSIT